MVTKVLTPDRVLPDPETEPTITVTRAARILGVSSATAYNAVERGDIPSVQVVGHRTRVVVPTALLLEQYGLTEGRGPGGDVTWVSTKDAAARRANWERLQRSRVERYVCAVIDVAADLTEEQRARLAAILAGGPIL